MGSTEHLIRSRWQCGLVWIGHCIASAHVGHAFRICSCLIVWLSSISDWDSCHMHLFSHPSPRAFVEASETKALRMVPWHVHGWIMHLFLASHRRHSHQEATHHWLCKCLHHADLPRSIMRGLCRMLVFWYVLQVHVQGHRGNSVLLREKQGQRPSVIG